MLAINGSSGIDQTWWVFWVPALILGIFLILETFLLRDNPSGAGFEDFDTGDASSGEMDKVFNLKEILVKILTNKIIITIAIIEFCSGIMRNGIMHWYLIFTNDMGYVSDFFVKVNWGLLLMLAGVFGGIFAGVISDKIFGSRRGPVAALLYGLMLLSTIAMWPLVTSTNDQVKNGFEVIVEKNLVDKYKDAHQIDLAHIRARIEQNYQIKSVDSTANQVTWEVYTPDRKKMIATKIQGIQLAEYERYNKYKGENELLRVEVKDVAKVLGAPSDNKSYWLGFIVVFMSLCVIGVHGMLSGTSTMDFGGRRAAATAVGMIDGFVYLGTGVQSLSLGFLTTQSWNYWPPFLIPFAIIGLILSIRIWYAFPHAKRKGH